MCGARYRITAAGRTISTAALATISTDLYKIVTTVSTGMPTASGMRSFFMKYSCAGWPPLADGVIAETKKPTNEYKKQCPIRTRWPTARIRYQMMHDSPRINATDSASPAAHQPGSA